MSAQYAVQKAIYDRLRASSALAAVLAVDPDGGSPSLPAVFDHVPQAAASEDDSRFPYIVVGDGTAGEFDADEIRGQETVETLHVYDRYRGRGRIKQVLDAIYTVLHDATLAVSGQHFVFCYWEFSQVLPEDGPKSQHAVTRFRIVTHE